MHDENITKKLNALYDVVHASPIKITESTYKYEKEIEDRLEKLEYVFDIVDNNNIVKEIESLTELANRRNDILRMSN